MSQVRILPGVLRASCEEGHRGDNQNRAPVDQRGCVEAETVSGEPAGYCRQTESQVADHIGESEKFATFIRVGKVDQDSERAKGGWREMLLPCAARRNFCSTSE